MNIEQVNFNPVANTDDFSCENYLYGCTDINAPNYNDLANSDDGSCLSNINGCTNPLAYNFDLSATIDDGSCISYESLNFDCKNPDYLEYNPNADIHSMAFCLSIKVEGCMNINAYNFNISANTDDNSCINSVEGCTNPLAGNYNPLANTNDYSCQDILLDVLTL